MNDRARCKLITRLSAPDVVLSAGEAAFIDSLGESEDFTDNQRARLDAIGRRFGHGRKSRPEKARHKPAPLEEAPEIEARLHPCKACGARPVLRGNPTNAVMNRWAVHCCASIATESPENALTLWNHWNPAAIGNSPA